jgi:hypothetical protein
VDGKQLGINSNTNTSSTINTISRPCLDGLLTTVLHFILKKYCLFLYFQHFTLRQVILHLEGARDRAVG